MKRLMIILAIVFLAGCVTATAADKKKAPAPAKQEQMTDAEIDTLWKYFQGQAKTLEQDKTVVRFNAVRNEFIKLQQEDVVKKYLSVIGELFNLRNQKAKMQVGK
jgi:PBP1b-binding outer membrane lipoprotein LpoB